MEFFKKTPNINFMKLRHVAQTWSAIVLAIAIGSLLYQGLNLATEFTGGIVAQAHYSQAVKSADVREALRTGGFTQAEVQHFGQPQEVLIHLRTQGDNSNESIKSQLGDLLGSGARIERVDVVGPEVGASLAQKGIFAIVATLVLMMVYLWFRFEWRLAVGAIVATFHDLVFVIGLFSIFQIQFDLTVLGGVLAMMGYSVNDTVIIFDRIREDFRKKRRASAYDVINGAVNETLARTIMTSSLTQIVIIAMLIVGGPALFGFALSLFVGIIVGTYSSIYIGSATALMLGVSKQDLMIKKKEDLVDDRP